ncbi:hypothetical protein G1H11_13490 [Phytoactinopolyspora alkaliphila]|uniref:Uncharacterized protein n=1 Tax=Phytoactinopolyspora alkaliphila TaxID=1783498 RepID=A0A6N9YMX1_9ACTN|nr:hypothetical protein [Phytoactinopolyspora alkaliphila]NED96322.1 hypothetical protein [Phytoactinopolyspora alkaliphila]
MGDPDANREYTSMDVDALGDAVDDLDATLTGLTDRISHLESDFTYFGVDKANLNKLLEAKSDLETIMPDMRRRHSLAVQRLAELQSGGWSGDGVISFEGTDILNDLFDSVEDAQEAGRELADQVNDANGEIPQEVWDELAQYGHDPDFAEAFVNGLDPAARGFLLMEPYKGESSGDGPDEAATRALTTVFSTASFRIDYDVEFISEMNTALRDMGLHPEGIVLVDSMAHLMNQGGHWNHESVVAFAEAALHGEYEDIGKVGDWPGVINALAKNPRAAAEYMHKHPDEVWEQAQVIGPVTSTQEWNEAWAAFVKAGTIDAHSIYERLRLYDDGQANLAEQNAATWIVNVGSLEEPFPFTDEMRAVFVDITEQYWDEFMYAFSAPAGVPQLPDGTPIPINGIDPGIWDEFITEGMRSEEGAARTFELFHNQVQDIRNGRGGDHAASGWDGHVAGQLSKMFLANWNQVLDERGASAEDAKEFRDGIIDWLIGAGFDPKGAAEDIAGKPKEMAQQILGDLVKGWMDDLTEEQAQELETSVFGYHRRWRDYANQRLEQNELPYNNPDIEPYDDGTVTWDGDPAFYERHYGGTFTDSNGRLLPFEEIVSDPDALAAYNAWLQDPAVQQATNGFFRDENGPD